jgi:hypothetical protein
MKKITIILFLFCFSQQIFSQNINFSEHISPIIYNKCTSCHRPGEIGPMPFTNYQQVSNFGAMIAAVTQSGYMPPWPPDANYSKLVGERILSAQEKTLIQQWVAAGMPQGNPSLEAAMPNFPAGSALGTPSLVIPMAQSYPIKNSNQDEYRVFVLPTGLTQDAYLTAMEFRPGNTQVVHHAIVMSESTGIGNTLDTQDTTGYGYASFGGFNIPANQLDDFHLGWAPGALPDYFPLSTGQKLKANSNLLLQIHYAPSTTFEIDSSYLNLFFTPNTPQRFVNTQQWAYPQLFLPANQKTTVKRFLTLPSDVSLLSITPHSHLLGESWEVYAVRPDGDTVPIVKIPEWDFNWQGTYKPEKLIKLPRLTKIYAECTYDNTALNPNNPSNPPIPVSWGENTTDEMFYLIMQFLPYQAGDEDIALSTHPEILEQYNQKQNFDVYPNPAYQDIHFSFLLPANHEVSISILDVSGRVVSKVVENEYFAIGFHTVNATLQKLPKGNYVVQLKYGAQNNFFRKLVIK